MGGAECARQQKAAANAQRNAEVKQSHLPCPGAFSENSSINSAVAAGTSAASPVATRKRAATICSKFWTKPEATVQTLQTSMPAPITRGRL